MKGEITMSQNDFTERIIRSRETRDIYVNHFEVLDKVKKLLCLPGTELMSTDQVADYYEVSVDHIKRIYSNNKEEIDQDGTYLLPRSYYSKDFSEVANMPLPAGYDVTSVEGNSYYALYSFDDGQNVKINNRGLRAFSKRAVLRIGMMLQMSDVAQEVRTQLLNLENNVSEEIKVKDINDEQKLMLEVGMAMASGDIQAVAVASTKLIDFKNRYINKLETDNKGLAGEVLTWNDRSKLNAGVRKLASTIGASFHMMYNELYKNLQYKYGICLMQRGKKPYLQWVKENEWDKVIKVFCAMCEAYGQSPSDMFQQTVPMDNLVV